MPSIPLNRRTSSKSELDYFPTPPWATRAFCEFLKQFAPIKRHSVWEPACGEGYMSRPLGEYFKKVYATDIYDRSESFSGQDAVSDFLLDWDPEANPSADWIITNPPFNQASDFIDLSLSRAKKGVAMLVKQQFLESHSRYNSFFNFRPPQWVLQYVERVPMHMNRMDPSLTTNQSYIWLVWFVDKNLKNRVQKGDPATRLYWIKPSRATLERPSDYTFVGSAGNDMPEITPMLDLMGSK